MSVVTKEFQYGDKKVVLETGRIARQASGAVVASLGETVVLVTCVARKEADTERDFFPLTVDYQEKTYAAGKIPGGFFKREGRPSEKETLTCRLIDRPVRPLFPKGFKNEVQIIATVLSLASLAAIAADGSAIANCAVQNYRRAVCIEIERAAKSLAAVTAIVCIYTVGTCYAVGTRSAIRSGFAVNTVDSGIRIRAWVRFRGIICLCFGIRGIRGSLRRRLCLRSGRTVFTDLSLCNAVFHQQIR